MKIMVTGTTGFLGGIIIKLLDKEMINNFKKLGLKIPKNDNIKKYL